MAPALFLSMMNKKFPEFRGESRENLQKILQNGIEERGNPW